MGKYSVSRKKRESRAAGETRSPYLPKGRPVKHQSILMALAVRKCVNAGVVQSDAVEAVLDAFGNDEERNGWLHIQYKRWKPLIDEWEAGLLNWAQMSQHKQGQNSLPSPLKFEHYVQDELGYLPGARLDERDYGDT